ncbi:MAG: Cof-type HAD-IIB family hydrolase [Bacteroidia bacterium]|nr:Cof-type HAD-IIB family hydrolase [Bacteroidia bacterium]
MELSKVKLVVTDMDGTLLNSKHEVSERFFEVYHKLRAKGIQFVAASGRQYNNIVSKLVPIKDDLIFIAENGGIVINGEEEWLHIPLDESLKNRVLTVVENSPDMYPVLCTKNMAYIRKDHTDFVGLLQEYYTQFGYLDSLVTFADEVIKIAVFHEQDSEKYIYPVVRQFENESMVKVSGQQWVDLSHIDAHKGHALKEVQTRLNISPDETIVFGDYNNDLEMMGESKFSFAMANAHPNVHAVARYTTASNDAYGVEIVLEKLLATLS